VTLAAVVLAGALTTACAKHVSATIERTRVDPAAPLAPPAYEWTARAAQVPTSILFAVAREESGMPLHGRWVPWPWTLNLAGVPHRFASQGETCAALWRALQRVPSRRIDVGLGQINLGYYGNRVATPCDLLNPYLNLLLAAEILHRFHRIGEDWMVAVGRYHRPAGGAAADQYRRDVANQLAEVLTEAGETTLAKASLP